MKKVLIILSLIIIIAATVAIIKVMPQNNSQPNSETKDSSTYQTTSSNSEPEIKDPSKGTIVSVSDLKGKKILVEKHYLNYAFSFEHEGTIVCTDGTIYNYKYSNEDELSPTPYNKIIEASDDVIEHVTSFEGRIPKESLEKLSSLLPTIKEDYESKNVAMDAGEDTIIYYNYDKNKIITLKSTGDSIVRNNSKNTEEVLKILDSYHIRINE